jgi:hypothetical protein
MVSATQGAGLCAMRVLHPFLRRPAERAQARAMRYLLDVTPASRECHAWSVNPGQSMSNSKPRQVCPHCCARLSGAGVGTFCFGGHHLPFYKQEDSLEEFLEVLVAAGCTILVPDAPSFAPGALPPFFCAFLRRLRSLLGGRGFSSAPGAPLKSVQGKRGKYSVPKRYERFDPFLLGVRSIHPASTAYSRCSFTVLSPIPLSRAIVSWFGKAPTPSIPMCLLSVQSTSLVIDGGPSFEQKVSRHRNRTQSLR